MGKIPNVVGQWGLGGSSQPVRGQYLSRQRITGEQDPTGPSTPELLPTLKLEPLHFFFILITQLLSLSTISQKNFGTKALMYSKLQ